MDQSIQKSCLQKQFGNVLRRYRTERGVSQQALALEGNFDRTFISLIERGLRCPSIYTIFQLASVLGVRPSELIRAVEENASSI